MWRMCSALHVLPQHIIGVVFKYIQFYLCLLRHQEANSCACEVYLCKRDFNCMPYGNHVTGATMLSAYESRGISLEVRRFRNVCYSGGQLWLRGLVCSISSIFGSAQFQGTCRRIRRMATKNIFYAEIFWFKCQFSRTAEMWSVRH